MKFIENEIYHVYNRGNNRHPVFFNDENYIFFLKKIQKELSEYCDILAYCLMPNHYHLLILIKDDSGRTTLSRLTTSSEFSSRQTTQSGSTTKPSIDYDIISRKIGTLQSSYTRAIQKQQNITGSLFQQKAKNKLIEISDDDYLDCCFHYIHQNPLRSQLVDKLENWKYSSFNEYRNQQPFLCNLSAAKHLDLYSSESFYEDSYATIDEELIKKIL